MQLNFAPPKKIYIYIFLPTPVGTSTRTFVRRFHGCPTLQTFWLGKLMEQASKRPRGPFWPKPARASAFIRVYILLNADARKSISVRQASVFNTTKKLMNADVPAGIAMPARTSVSSSRHTNQRRSLCGLGPKRPAGPFRSFFLIIHSAKMFAGIRGS